MKHLTLWTWLKRNGLKQLDLAKGLSKSESFVSTRMSRDGFTADEQEQVLAWAQSVRPQVVRAELFETEAA